MKWGLSILALCALLAATAPEGGAAEQGGGDAKLLKMVVLSRHGVRSPTQSSETLESWSRKDWPEWPVKRGELTRRGASLVSAIWERDAASKPDACLSAR
jgi:Histidine acid phosphatase.